MTAVPPLAASSETDPGHVKYAHAGTQVDEPAAGAAAAGDGRPALAHARPRGSGPRQQVRARANQPPAACVCGLPRLQAQLQC